MKNKIIASVLNIFLILQLVVGVFVLPQNSLAAGQTWNLVTATDYVFDSAKVEISSGQAQLKAAGSPDWYNASWPYRKAVTINNTVNSNTLTNFQVKVSVTYDSSMQTDFDDIRFADSDGTTLVDYWLESKTDAASAIFWVEVPTITAASNDTIYMYYGNSSVSSASNISNTFLFGYDPRDGGIQPTDIVHAKGMSQFGLTPDPVIPYGTGNDYDINPFELGNILYVNAKTLHHC